MADEPKRDDPTDFSQFRKPARKVDLSVVDSANEALGYSAQKPIQAPAPAPQRRLFRTGRNVQFNIKASADLCYACDFYKFCIKASSIDLANDENWTNEKLRSERAARTAR